MGSGGWRERRLLLVVAGLALLASGPATLAAFKIANRWAVGGATAATAVVVAAAAMWQERYKRVVERREQQAHHLEMGCLVLPDGQLPKVRQVTDPILLGVHPSALVSGDAEAVAEVDLPERMPTYVARDVDAEFRQRLSMSGFVLLVGDSTAGKSRAAYEGISATLQDHVLIVPQSREAVSAAITKAASDRRCVLWLDDLEKYLGQGGLTRSNIARLLADGRSHRVIVSTLRAVEEARITSEAAAGQHGWESQRPALEVLEQAHRIQLPRMFSMWEQERARANSWDPRIAHALTHADEYGIAEYLAAGPELLRDWENAWSPNTDRHAPSHPRGAALIAAAIDIRRGGYSSPLPRSLLEGVHDYYLQRRGGPRLRPEPLTDAWAWATRSQRATTALLQDVDDKHVQVFDYLLDTMQIRSSPGANVPDSVLEAAVAVSAPADADNIGRTAYYHGRYHLAEKAWLASYESRAEELGRDHLDTLYTRGSHANMLRDTGRPAEAESEHQAIVNIGIRVYGPQHPVVLYSRNGRAFALIRLGRLEEAEQEFRTVRDVSSQALGPEHDVTMTSRHLRAIALRRLGRLGEAEAENRFVLNAWKRDRGPEDLSTLLSWGNLAHVLFESGQLEQGKKEAYAVLDIRARLLGPDHPDTIDIRSIIARFEVDSNSSGGS